MWPSCAFALLSSKGHDVCVSKAVSNPLSLPLLPHLQRLLRISFPVVAAMSSCIWMPPFTASNRPAIGLSQGSALVGAGYCGSHFGLSHDNLCVRVVCSESQSRPLSPRLTVLLGTIQAAQSRKIVKNGRGHKLRRLWSLRTTFGSRRSLWSEGTSR